MSIKSSIKLTTLILICIICFSSTAYAEENSTYNSSSKISGNYNNDIWKYKKKFMLGYTTGELDQKASYGGKISSRWGVSLTSGWNIYLHRKPIGGFLKFGINIDIDLNYLNFAKGSGSLSDLNGGYQDDSETNDVSLGRHYLTAGVAIGPNATFAPFYASANQNLASLKFRPYFHVVPSFATYMVSDDEDLEMHNAFAFWYAAGMEIQWKRLILGIGWKGCTAKYKGMIDETMADVDDEYKSNGKHKFDMNMLNFSLGIAF